MTATSEADVDKMKTRHCTYNMSLDLAETLLSGCTDTQTRRTDCSATVETKTSALSILSFANTTRLPTARSRRQPAVRYYESFFWLAACSLRSKPTATGVSLCEQQDQPSVLFHYGVPGKPRPPATHCLRRRNVLTRRVAPYKFSTSVRPSVRPENAGHFTPRIRSSPLEIAIADICPVADPYLTLP